MAIVPRAYCNLKEAMWCLWEILIGEFNPIEGSKQIPAKAVFPFFFNYTFCPYEFLVFCRSKPPESVTEMNVVICTFRFHDIFLTLVCLFCARLSYRWLMFLKYFRSLPERLSLFSDLYTDISIMTQYHLGSWQKL